MCFRLYGVTTLFIVMCHQYVHTQQRYKTIYQKIQQEPEYSGFNSLVRNNRVAKLNLHYDQLTVFVPTNKAFEKYEDDDLPALAAYHMSFEIKPLHLLRHTNSVVTVDLDHPPLWVTNAGGEMYVNNAKIIQEKSDYTYRSRDGNMGKQQILHLIDEVLNPIIVSPKFSPSAFDFLSSTEKWNLGSTKTVTKFYHKVKEHKLEHRFKQSGGHTFFIPVDNRIDPYKFNAISDYVVSGHVIPNYVLFTRPTERNFAYESLANDNYVYIVLSFVETDGKLFVKGLTKGDSSGEFFSEVIVPNIPVKNGVVHLIYEPLGILRRTLRPFPFLAIADKLSNDPELSVVFDMGANTSFNKMFSWDNISLTYFVTKDATWRNIKQHGLVSTETDEDIIGKHLVISQTPFSMEQLFSLTRANNYAEIELATVKGQLKMAVFNIQGEYYIKWQRKYIKVVRPDYECTNGFVHILAGPLVNFKNFNAGVGIPAEKPIYGDYWNSVNNMLRIH